MTSIPTDATTAAPLGMVAVTTEDFVPLPKRNLNHRGVNLSRATLIRAVKFGRLKSKLFRQPGSTKGRRYLLRASLDSFVDSNMLDVPLEVDQ